VNNQPPISLNEANETEYWLDILKDTGYINDKLFRSLYENCKELLRLLIAKKINNEKINN
jgi:four helix bundle protein